MVDLYNSKFTPVLDFLAVFGYGRDQNQTRSEDKQRIIFNHYTARCSHVEIFRAEQSFINQVCYQVITFIINTNVKQSQVHYNLTQPYQPHSFQLMDTDIPTLCFGGLGRVADIPGKAQKLALWSYGNDPGPL